MCVWWRNPRIVSQQFLKICFNNTLQKKLDFHPRQQQKNFVPQTSSRWCSNIIIYTLLHLLTTLCSRTTPIPAALNNPHHLHPSQWNCLLKQGNPKIWPQYITTPTHYIYRHARCSATIGTYWHSISETDVLLSHHFTCSNPWRNIWSGPGGWN